MKVGAGVGEILRLELAVLTLRFLEKSRQRKELWASLLMSPTHERSNMETSCLVTYIHTSPAYPHAQQPRDPVPVILSS